jgi:hypothetical protein
VPPPVAELGLDLVHYRLDLLVRDLLLGTSFARPDRNFSRSKGSLPPSLLITINLNGSRRSYVVNLFSHDRHSLRRLTASFVSESRESITFVSSKSQYGHCIPHPYHSNTISGTAKT